ncbi:MAG: hypothetical protein FWD71_12330 [Oscillospiraceae bacterium]|nr:hypothetical protein [Oscillospiraceae bacterium]
MDMYEDDGSIRIIEEMMNEIRRVALEKDASVSDIVHEALSEFLYFRQTGINFFDVISSIEKSMNDMNAAGHFVVNADLNKFAVSVKSPLRYIYRPELKYEVRISHSDEMSIGKISVILRSRDIDTLRSFADFFSFWIELETKYIFLKSNRRITYITDAGYFSRKIYISAEQGNPAGSKAIGTAVSDYIHVFDELFKYYFYNPNGGGIRREIENLYVSYAANGKLKI